MKKAPVLQLEQISGDTFPDRDAAQNAALSLLSENFQAVVQDLLERGVLVNVDGKLLPGPAAAGAKQ